MIPKLTAVLALWLSFSSLLEAQPDFPTQDIYWEESTFTIAGSFLRYRLLCGDTTINDQSYAKLYDVVFEFDGEDLIDDTIPTPQYAGAIRADDSLVFYIFPGETLDKLLYDFSVEVEESIDLPNTTQGNEGTYSVTEIDSVEVNGSLRKRIFLDNIFGGTDDVWIEGLGSVKYGLLDRGLGAVFDYGSSLRCIHDLDADFTFKPSPNGPCTMAITGCDLLNAAVDRTGPGWSVRVFPNPVEDRLQIDLPLDGADWQIELWTLDGRRLRAWSPAADAYPLGGLAGGVYFLKIRRDQQYVYGEKLIKQ